MRNGRYQLCAAKRSLYARTVSEEYKPTGYIIFAIARTPYLYDVKTDEYIYM